jgi:erythromycin esterase-like protein
MYKELIQMGELVDRSLGDRVFTIGFTAYQGRAGACFRSPFELTEPPEGTLESLMEAAGLENAVVPLRSTSADAGWLSEPLYARPLGYRWMLAQWPKHFDAIVFNRTMTPSTR